MKRYQFAITISVITLVVFAGIIILQNIISRPSADMNMQHEDIVVHSPTASMTVESPLVVVGEARGTWYFEASFPIELVDANGLRLAIVPAQAQEDWMTEAFVPFSATLTFNAPTTATGTLILHKDNPSGLPEYDDELRIPIRFE